MIVEGLLTPVVHTADAMRSCRWPCSVFQATPAGSNHVGPKKAGDVSSTKKGVVISHGKMGNISLISPGKLGIYMDGEKLRKKVLI